MYIFNKITVKPQLPTRINRLSEIANNLWWSWNTEFLKIFKEIDIDLWERVDKNPVKFLKLVSQEKLEEAVNNAFLLKQYDKIVNDFDGYMNSKNTWFSKKYSNNKNDLIAYFSAEYGLDETLPIYSGGLGILSGDHLKSASDLCLPFVAVGLLYKNGYFHQKIDGYGNQHSIYKDIDLENLPINPVKNEKGDDLKILLKLPTGNLYLKVWNIKVGRITLYLMDSDIDENDENNRGVTLKLYGGDKEMRIKQEIVLGMGGVNLLKTLGLNPSVYHMNEGHSSFLLLEVIKNIIKEKKISFNMARDIASSQTVFTTHTPVPAGNDIFTVELIEKYLKGYWTKLGIEKDEFLRLGMQPNDNYESGFNMGILALKIAGKKNGVSKLHGAVSRELFKDIWPSIAANESPITHITNGIHTCSWLAPNLKLLFNKYLMPYWQDSIQIDEIWKKIESIPNDMLWKEHMIRKNKLFDLVRHNITNSMRANGKSYDDINQIVSKLNPNALTIGFARRFATYKRATLIFRDIERITQILNNSEKPVQLIFAGKAHPADKEGQDLLRYIYELSNKPQFKGKIFILENYNIGIARYLVSGVDVWLNNPRRPMEASGTSGQKASVNGVINFSVLDGWWAEGYNTKNGWAIGTNDEYDNYAIQDNADAESIYNILENKIIPIYYEKNENGISDKWLQIMKSSIITTGGKYSTARMVSEYMDKLYMPLIELNKKHYTDLTQVAEYNEWKNKINLNWDRIKIEQLNNLEDVLINAGESIEVKCNVVLPDVDINNIMVEVYAGKIASNGIIQDIVITPMELIGSDIENRKYTYKANINLTTGGNYGYTFRVMPKHEMLLHPENLNLVKWIEQ